jgi:hypothetical protein
VAEVAEADREALGELTRGCACFFFFFFLRAVYLATRRDYL